MTQTTAPSTFKSPLHEMTQTTPTCLWNDSASISELTYSIEHGAVGATCNPVIVLGVLKKEMGVWKDRIRELMAEKPKATEEEIGWQLVREVSTKAASLLKPVLTRMADAMAGFPYKRIPGSIVTRTPSSARRKSSPDLRPT